MTRTILSIATALLSATTLFAPAAEACISCEYKPEVVHNPASSHAARSYEKTSARIASKALAARLAKERAAKAQLIANKAEIAKAAPAETTKVAAVETQPVKESKTVAAASPVAAEATPAEETKVAVDVGCKRFVPAVGATVTAPCD